jgi:hypothetical protein
MFVLGSLSQVASVSLARLDWETSLGFPAEWVAVRGVQNHRAALRFRSRVAGTPCVCGIHGWHIKLNNKNWEWRELEAFLHNLCERMPVNIGLGRRFDGLKITNETDPMTDVSLWINESSKNVPEWISHITMQVIRRLNCVELEDDYNINNGHQDWESYDQEIIKRSEGQDSNQKRLSR